jgi:hypothetical protein
VVEVLLLVVALGVWHAVLMHLAAVPRWARTGLRIALALAILGETARFFVLETLPWQTRGNNPAHMQEALARAMDTAFWLDSAVAVAIAAAAVGLIGLSVRRGVYGPLLPP